VRKNLFGSKVRGSAEKNQRVRMGGVHRFPLIWRIFRSARGKQERHVTSTPAKIASSRGLCQVEWEEQDNPGGCHRSLLLRAVKSATSRHVANACSQIPDNGRPSSDDAHTEKSVLSDHGPERNRWACPGELQRRIRRSRWRGGLLRDLRRGCSPVALAVRHAGRIPTSRPIEAMIEPDGIRDDLG